MKFVQPIRDPEMILLICQKLREGSSSRYASERNRLLFMTGINTGLRISDILTLRVCDVKGEDYITVKEKKTSKVNKIIVVPLMKREFKAYLVGKSDRQCLFPSRNGVNRPLTRFGAYKMLRKVAGEVGLSEIGTHTLRKTWAYHVYKKKKNIGAVMEALNHSSEAETLRYIGVNQDMRDELRLSVELGGD